MSDFHPSKPAKSSFDKKKNISFQIVIVVVTIVEIGAIEVVIEEAEVAVIGAEAVIEVGVIEVVIEVEAGAEIGLLVENAEDHETAESVHVRRTNARPAVPNPQQVAKAAEKAKVLVVANRHCIGMCLHQASSTLLHYNTRLCKLLVKYLQILLQMRHRYLDFQNFKYSGNIDRTARVIKSKKTS
jgi:hypothetical protein